LGAALKEHDWEHGSVVFRPGQPHVWAPDVWRDPASGRFYLYYTVNQTVGVAEAGGPRGPFQAVRKFFDQAIDAHLFRDDDGALYLYYVQLPGFRISVQPMASPTQPQGKPQVILQPESDWEKRAGHVTEGPWMIKHRGRYYLLYSGSGADTPDYAVGYAVADHPLGPFKRAPHNPIIQRGEGLYGPGHGCAIQDPDGRWWHIYHQKRTARIEWSRFICIDPLWFDEGGNLYGRATRGVAQPAPAAGARGVLVEGESFAHLGGWVIDQQSMDQMGSPYVLAHGLGVPVSDARTQVDFPQPGRYRLWVRTRDWAAPWKTPDTSAGMKASGTPGLFQVLIDGKAVERMFGDEGAEWHWQDGGAVEIPSRSVALALRDRTGFAGRCDALLFTADGAQPPPNDLAALTPWRRALLGIPAEPLDAGEYDLVVVGGGMAGCCAAVSAARLSCKVALIHDRPVLGGNNSSEVRVGLSGLIHQQPYPRLGDLVEELGPIGHWSLYQARQAPDLPRSKEVLAVIQRHPEKRIHNAGPASNYEDEKKIALAWAEKNLALHLGMRANHVVMQGNRIRAVVAQDIRTGQIRKFRARLVADCTGDGVIGALAGADFAYGRESRAEYGEDSAPLQKDEMVMGTSVQWYAEEDREPSAFPECPWAVRFDEKSCVKTTRGDWDWETGFHLNHATQIEQIRDYGLRVVFGNWAVLKNHPRFRDEFARQRLKWVAYIGGKRESRRLLGDVVLRQQDVVEAKPFPDASVTTTWTIDLHYPREPLCACDAFRSEARNIKISPYPIPYRCFYSRNIENLMMAGRNISVTHVALGTVRVMRTGGMMGEVVGMAASLCKKHQTVPRGVYQEHLEELKSLLRRGVGRQSNR